MPDYVKQLKIGNSNYNIKAEKAANQNSDAAVVRDIEYGTNAPSGGESGQLYLQYDASSSTNNYIYAEDTASDQQNVIDNYYSKNEIDTLLTNGFDAVWEHEGIKNLLDITGTSVTRSGVTFTVNTDGTVTASGTATADTWITLGTFTGEVGKEYILNGCPSGGSNSTWRISLGTNYDTGDGVTFTGGSQQTCAIGIFSGHAVNNLIFKPMIRDARTGSTEFVSPHKHEVYSTDEKYIGQYLGVPLFRKTLYVPTVSANSTTVAHGISSFYDIVRVEMTWYDTTDKRWFSNIRWDSASIYYKLNSVDATNVYFGGSGATWSSRVQRVRITLEYIRT